MVQRTIKRFDPYLEYPAACRHAAGLGTPDPISELGASLT